MTQPILFLDVDGVLNYRALWTIEAATFCLCPKAITLLNKTIVDADALVVMSSAWRHSPEHVEYLKQNGGFERPHKDWRTGDRYGPLGLRGEQIEAWLKEHPEVDRYAIVDDNADMLPHQLSRFVHTDPETGLLEKHANRLFDILMDAGD